MVPARGCRSTKAIVPPDTPCRAALQLSEVGVHQQFWRGARGAIDLYERMPRWSMDPSSWIYDDLCRRPTHALVGDQKATEGLQFRPTPVFPKLLQKLQTADPDNFHQITILIPISARLFSCERRCCTDEGSGPAELVSFGIFAAAHFCHTSNLRPSCGRMPPIFYTKIIEWTMYT